jgi:hypothetical protein
MDYAPKGERRFMVDEVGPRWERMTNIVNLEKPHKLVSIYEFFQYRRTSRLQDESIYVERVGGLAMVNMISSMISK